MSLIDFQRAMEDSMNQSLRTANDLNALSSYLALRDLQDISSASIESVLGKNNTDLLILLGNSLLYSADIASLFLNQNLAEKMLISGGIGHSTSYLKKTSSGFLTSDQLNSDTLSEAEILKFYLLNHHNIDPDRILTETRSSNCGANAEESNKVLDKHRISPQSIILIQDPTMQRRTYASFLKVWGINSGVKWINFAPFVPKVKWEGDKLKWEGDKLKIVNRNIPGLWNIDRFISLVMGEIPRLRNDSNGYGPNGKGFIVPVDIPKKVEEAYSRLETIFTTNNREI
jgi:uncharacterized SAM-binding protein YcdF (DUF218 family)